MSLQDIRTYEQTQAHSKHTSAQKTSVQEQDGSKHRPFTSMIDRLIADERNRSKSTDDRELKLGPIENPQFNGHSSTNSADFQPLTPEYSETQLTPVVLNELSPRSDVTDDSTPPTSSRATQSFPELIKPRSVSTPVRQKSTPATKTRAALIPEGLSDSEFMDYYKQLTPADRKKQLFVQKQALLMEQERLKHVLAQQESLLEKKHDELRRQQEIQQERLNFFEQTGSFPRQPQQQQLFQNGVVSGGSIGGDPHRPPARMANHSGSGVMYPSGMELPYQYAQYPQQQYVSSQPAKYVPVMHPMHSSVPAAQTVPSYTSHPYAALPPRYSAPQYNGYPYSSNSMAQPSSSCTVKLPDDETGIETSIVSTASVITV